MTQTQAFTVDWTVTVAPEGDVSNDVTEIVYTRESGNPNSVTVELDTSQRPHALEEQAVITVELSDGNDTVTFDGFVDDVNDDADNPAVTVDARTLRGRLDDGTVIGRYDKNTVWDVIEGVIDEGPSALQDFGFDIIQHLSDYGLFIDSTDFGRIDIAHIADFDIDEETFVQHETVSDTRGKQAELRLDTYTNNTSTIYVMDIVGKDADGNTVTASLDMPPGADARDAYGTDTIRLALSGGNELWTEVNSVSTDIPDATGTDLITLEGNIVNFVKTDWRFTAGEDTSHRAFLDQMVNYIASLDGGTPWEYVLDDSDNIRFRPQNLAKPSLFTFTEGQNVIRPMARRNLDGVANYVQVTGPEGVNVWTWAWDGAFYTMWGYDNPHERGVFPTDTSDKFTWKWKDSPGTNDIDEIDLRATSVDNDRITGWYSALQVSHDVMDNVYRESVSGTAPVTGILDAQPGDYAEVYYPSRGIPQKVVDNTYTVQKVEFQVTPRDARTEVEFGVKRPTASEVIGDAAVSEIQARRKGRGGVNLTGGFAPVVGEITAVNDDGTVTVSAEDGETYENVRII